MKLEGLLKRWQRETISVPLDSRSQIYNADDAIDLCTRTCLSCISGFDWCTVQVILRS